MVTDLIRSRGQHRLTYTERLTARIDRTHLAVVVAFWGLIVAGSGFVAGFVWGQAMS